MMLVELAAVPATALPVAEFSRHLHLGTGFADDGSQNAVLESYLRAALAAIEARIGKALIQRAFSWQLTAWHGQEAQGLPIAPVQAITALKLTDRAGVTTTVDPARYRLEKDSQRPRLVSARDSLPPVPAGGTAEILFEAGFGPAWADIPVDLAQAVFLLAAHYYENRHEAGARESLMPFGVMALIEAHRNVRLLGAGA